MNPDQAMASFKAAGMRRSSGPHTADCLRMFSGSQSALRVRSLVAPFRVLRWVHPKRMPRVGTVVQKTATDALTGLDVPRWASTDELPMGQVDELPQVSLRSKDLRSGHGPRASG